MKQLTLEQTVGLRNHLNSICESNYSSRNIYIDCLVIYANFILEWEDKRHRAHSTTIEITTGHHIDGMPYIEHDENTILIGLYDHYYGRSHCTYSAEMPIKDVANDIWNKLIGHE